MPIDHNDPKVQKLFDVELRSGASPLSVDDHDYQLGMWRALIRAGSEVDALAARFTVGTDDRLSHDLTPEEVAAVDALDHSDPNHNPHRPKLLDRAAGLARLMHDSPESAFAQAHRDELLNDSDPVL